MTALTLTKKRLFAGVWEGVLTGPAGATPTLAMRNGGDLVPGLMVDAAGDGVWTVTAPIAVERINDQVQTFAIVDEATQDVLQSFSILAGDALDDDLRAQVDLMRAELDILKRAFRRHCAEQTD